MQTIKPIPKSIARKKNPPLRLGELLLKEGFIQDSDLKKVLAIQTKGAKEAALSVGALMVKKGMISDQDLDGLHNHPDLHRKLGTLIVKKKIISKKELRAALELKHPKESLGQFLVRRHLISQKRLNLLLEQQQSGIKIEHLAVNIGLINESDLDRIMRIKSGHRFIGEILCDLKMVTLDDINYIIYKYHKHLKLGDILIRLGLISEKQCNKALQAQRRKQEKLGRILIKQNAITTAHLITALSKQFNIPYHPLNNFSFDSRQRRMLTNIVGKKKARKLKILPLSMKESRLQIGVAGPENSSIITTLNTLYPDFKIEPVLIRRKKYGELFAALYGTPSQDSSQKTDDTIRDIKLSELNTKGDRAHSPSSKTNGRITDQVVEDIIRIGINKGANDIHIEQDRQGTRLRYRVNEIYQEVETHWLNENLQETSEAIISRIKALAGLDITKKCIPQNGSFAVSYYNAEQDRCYELEFRVATCPAIIGENVTIRIIDSQKAIVGLESQNHSLGVLNPLKRMLKKHSGMVLVSGPTGSGKTSTLYAALRHIYHPGIKIITAENPIAYSFPGIMQTQINPEINLNFKQLLNSFLHMAPDVILVGEISDKKTACLSLDIAQTDHLILSALNANDAVSAVMQLLQLGISPNQIAASLNGVLAQRQVRKICSKCCMKYEPPEEQWLLFFNEYPQHLTFYKGIGCKSCGYTGYKGKTLISEFFEINQKIMLALSKGINERQLKRMALATGMKTMVDDGLLKLNQITLSEIIRVVPIEMIEAFFSQRQGNRKTSTNSMVNFTTIPGDIASEMRQMAS